MELNEPNGAGRKRLDLWLRDELRLALKAAFFPSMLPLLEYGAGVSPQSYDKSNHGHYGRVLSCYCRSTPADDGDPEC